MLNLKSVEILNFEFLTKFQPCAKSDLATLSEVFQRLCDHPAFPGLCILKVFVGVCQRTWISRSFSPKKALLLETPLRMETNFRSKAPSAPAQCNSTGNGSRSCKLQETVARAASTLRSSSKSFSLSLPDFFDETFESFGGDGPLIAPCTDSPSPALRQHRHRSMF